MNALMREWIAPVVKSELTSVLNDPTKDNVFGNDKSLLRKHLTKSRHVQIIHLSTDPYDQISDGKTCVEAEFDQAAAHSFQQTTGRSFFDLEGGVIAIKDYDITVDLRVNLPVIRFFIRAWTLRGSEGSRTFGKPTNIMQEPEIQQIVEDLTNALQTSPQDQASVASESPSSIRSQDDDPSTIQMATQIQKTQKAATEAKHIPKPALLNLLAMLKNGPKDLASSKIQALEAARPSPTNSILKPISEKRAKGMSTKLEVKANRQQSQFLTQYHPSSSDSVPDEQLVAVKRHAAEHMPVSSDSEKENSQDSLNSAEQKATKNQSIATKVCSAQSDMSPTLNDAEKDNSQEHTHSPKRTVPVREITSAQSHTCNTNQKATAPFVDMFQDSNPFEGLKRVPRKFVRIPAAQQALLERRDSWYEPGSGGRQTYATIPPKAREQIDAFLNRQLESDHSDQSDDGSGKSVDAIGSDDSQDEDAEAQDEPSRRAVNYKEAVGSTSASNQQLRQPSVLALGIAHVITVPSSGLHEGEQPGDEKLDIDDESSDNEPASSSSSLVGDMDEPEDPRGATQSTSKEESLSQPQSTDDLSEQSEQLPTPDTSRLPSLSHKKPSAGGAQTRMPSFPSSSPTEDDELPLALLHAVGDIFEEDEEPLDAPKTSQKLPCTTPPNPNLIQIKTTPSAYPHADGPGLLPPREPKGRTERNHSSQDVSSDQIIPATFDSLRPVHTSNSRRHLAMQSQTRQDESPEPASPPPTLQPRLETAEFTATTGLNCSSSTPPGEQATSPASSTRKQKSPIIQIPATSRKRVFRVDDASPKEKPSTPKLKQHPRASMTESGEDKAIDIKQFLKEKRHSWVRNHLQIKRSEQDAASDLEESRSRATATVDEEVRISSTYVEAPPRDSPNYKEHIRPTSVQPNSAVANKDGEADTWALIAQVGPDLRSPSPDNVAVVQKQFGVLPFASQEVVELRSPSPDGTIMGQEDIANIPFLASQAVSNHESSSLEADATLIAEEEVEKQLHASQSVSGLGDSAARNELAELQCAAPQEASDSQDLALDKDNTITKVNPPLESAGLDTSSQIMFYDEFKATYPDYEGSEGAFIRALVYLEWLFKECKTGPPYYDDFVRFMVLYERHVRENQHSKEKPPPGFVVYNQTIQKPVYKYNIISSRNLEAVLLTLNLQVVAFVRSKYWMNQETAKESTRKKTAGPIPVENKEEGIVADDQGTVSSNKPLSAQARPSQDKKSIPSTQSPLGNRFKGPKKPFFVTYSQLLNVAQQKPETESLRVMSQISSSGPDGKPRSDVRSQQVSVLNQRANMARQKEAVDTPVRASQLSSNGSGSELRRRKTVPWLTEKPDRLASSVISKTRDGPSELLMGGCGGKVDWAEIRRERKRREREEAARPLEDIGSPILGSLRDHVSPPDSSPSPRHTKRKRISESFTFGEQDDPFTESPKPSKAARRVTMPAFRSMGDLRNVSNEKKRKRTSEGSFSHETSFIETSKPSKAARRVTPPAAKSKEVEVSISPKLTHWERILERKRLDRKRPKSETIKKLTGIDFGTVKKPEGPAEPETQGFEFQCL